MNIEIVSSPNFYQGRSESIRIFVIHHTASTLDSAVDHFRNPGSQVSSHYLISHDGSRVVHMVGDENTAWHAKEANPFTIGIECEDYEGLPFNGYNTLNELLRQKAAEHNIVLGTYTIQPHKAYVNTECPGGVDMARIVSMATGSSVVSIPIVTIPTATTISYIPTSVVMQDIISRNSGYVNAPQGLKVREAPSTSGNELRVMLNGQGFYYTSIIEGESINGNNRWFLLEDGHYAWTGGASQDSNLLA